MPQFCILFYANYTILATQEGGHGPMAPPPKYAPESVTSSSQENTRKISKQFLFFGVILVRSPCHYYDVKKKPALFLPLKKCGHMSQQFLHGVRVLYDIYTVVLFLLLLRAG